MYFLVTPLPAIHMTEDMRLMAVAAREAGARLVMYCMIDTCNTVKAQAFTFTLELS